MEKFNKVIKLLSDNSIVVDYGQKEGAYKGEELVIFTPGSDIIYEGVNYGTLDMIKSEIEIVYTFPKFSVCQKIERKTVKTLGLNDFYTREIESVISLKMKKDEISKEIFMDKSPIKLGDFVKKKI